MTTIEWLLLLLCGLAAGSFMSVFYFGGLWWTLLRLPSARSPALLAFGSYFARLGVCLLGFVFLARASWLALGAAAVAFLASRTLLIRLWGPPRKSVRREAQAGTGRGEPVPERLRSFRKNDRE